MIKKLFYLVLLVFIVIYAFVQDARLKNTKFENGVVLVAGKEIMVKYITKENLAPAFGKAYSDSISVREDLDPRVKRFVLAHEIYHIEDNASWGGWIGKEIRANFFPALKDPMGFAYTAVTSLSPERLTFYYNRIKGGF